jgi:glutamate-1-semialdehyde 2,1-aminomutase
VTTLALIRDTDALATIESTGLRLQAGIRSILEARGLAFSFTGHPSMFGIVFSETVPTEYRDWANTDHELYDAIAVGMQSRGAMPEPDSREPWFVCEAHAQGDLVERSLSAFEGALDAALDERVHGKHPAAAEGAMAHPAGG